MEESFLLISDYRKYSLEDFKDTDTKQVEIVPETISMDSYQTPLKDDIESKKILSTKSSKLLQFFKFWFVCYTFLTFLIFVFSFLQTAIPSFFVIDNDTCFTNYIWITTFEVLTAFKLCILMNGVVYIDDWVIATPRSRYYYFILMS
jgi:hypothetical protein